MFLCISIFHPFYPSRPIAGNVYDVRTNLGPENLLPGTDPYSLYPAPNSHVKIGELQHTNSCTRRAYVNPNQNRPGNEGGGNIIQHNQPQQQYQQNYVQPQQPHQQNYAQNQPQQNYAQQQQNQPLQNQPLQTQNYQFGQPNPPLLFGQANPNPFTNQPGFQQIVNNQPGFQQTVNNQPGFQQNVGTQQVKVTRYQRKSGNKSRSPKR